jgi:hypothetical protein
MSTFIYRVGTKTRSNASLPMTLWALAMSVILTMGVVGEKNLSLWLGAGVTSALGVWLGSRGKFGPVFFAPLVSWLFAWPLMWIAAMVHYGIAAGFFVGLFLVTIGFLGLGFVEFAWLFLITALVAKIFTRSAHDEIIILAPDELTGEK